MFSGIKCMTKEDEYIRFINYVLLKTGGITFIQDTPEKAITVSFLRKIQSSAETILKIWENGYDACIIANHMTEGVILLNWILDDTKRIKDYEDYAFVEYIALIEDNLIDREELLKEIKQNNVQRFLKKKIKNQNISDEILLNREKYRDSWYKSETTLKDVSNKIKNELSQKIVRDIYEMYRISCSYKHYSSCVMPDEHDISDRWNKRASVVALRTAALCLYTALLHTNHFQNDVLDMEDIISKYSQI